METLADRADALEAEGAIDSATTLREQAARIAVARGDHKLARSLFQSVAFTQAELFAGSLTPTLAALTDLLDPSQEWRIEALRAAESWPEKGLEALAPLRAATVHDPDNPWWWATLIEALVVAENYDEAAASGERARSLPWTSKSRLRLELDVLEADARVSGLAIAEANWQRLLARVADGPSDERALAWQRRAVHLAQEDRPSEAEDAFLEAATAWSKSKAYAGQVADSWFGWRATLELSGGALDVDRQANYVAASIEGRRHALEFAAEHAEVAGLRARATDQLPDARKYLWQAYILRRRLGGLFDAIRITRLLGALHEDTGEVAAAVALYCAAGAEREARRVASDLEKRAIPSAVPVRGPSWQRSAAFAALAVCGRRAPTRFVDECSQELFADAQKHWSSPVSPQPAARAREALAGVFFALPPKLQRDALPLLRDAARGGYVPTAQPAAQALAAATVVGLSDETDLLVDIVVDLGARFAAIPLDVLAERIPTRPTAVARLREAALRRGQADALEVLALAGLAQEDPELVDLCTRRALSVRPTTITRAEHEVSIGMASFEGTGILARAAEPGARVNLAHNLLALAASDEEPESNRASAINAVFNLLPALPDSVMSEVRSAAERLARGEFAPSQWDREDAERLHPFSRFRVTIGRRGVLRAAGMELLGRVGQITGRYTEQIAVTATEALLVQDPGVLAAAIRVFARVPHAPLRLNVRELVAHPEPPVRAALAGLVVARLDDEDSNLLDPFVEDPDFSVRAALLALSPTSATGRTILSRLAEDDDALLRAHAHRILNMS